MSYGKDRAWSDKYLAQVSNILGQCADCFLCIEIASEERDTQQATDMVLLVSGAGTIAVRLRRASCKYRDLTIRSRRSSGHETELAKIQNGWAEWYFYGWLDDQERIAEWILVDLRVLRASGLLEMPQREINNYNGTYFVNISLGELLSGGCLKKWAGVKP